MSTGDTRPMYEWETLPWRKLERGVFKLQKRIHRASRQGDRKAVRRLQRLLLTSRAAKLLAVRRVTQDNRGKKTAGVDGVKSLPAPDRPALAESLSLRGAASPVRRVYIPKPGADELRPLGIPTLHDRASQTLVRFALEPEWEAKFEPNSYGFRPGRSCWDAIQAIFLACKQKAKYVLDADIAKCFDRIDHAALLRKVDAGPAVRRQLKAWLEAGYLDGDSLFPTEEGTPQGGAISPLLANIALHGLEELVRRRFPRRTVNRTASPPPALIRYADDFVVLHEDEAVVRGCRAVIAEWLRGMGLELKPSKTRVCHTLHPVDGAAGFDFLGVTVRHFPCGKTRSARNPHGRLLGYILLIKPSRTAVRRHVQRLRELIDQYRHLPQFLLIRGLNPVIRGWCNYHSTVVSKRVFCRLGHVLFRMLYAWARSRHPNKNRTWVATRYWRIKPGEGWTFRDPGKVVFTLHKHEATKIVRHVKVRGDRSPFDGDWVYWSSRQGRYPGVQPWVATLLRRQRGRCNWCGLYFRDGDVMEIDHVIPKSGGGAETFSNLQLLHGHCHDRKTALRGRGVSDNHPTPEERNDGKLSRPVLEPSRGSDTPA
jgi:RNA-directed DNA polymerase